MPSITSRTALMALLAHPSRHSKSPIMHNAAFRALDIDAVYLAFDVTPERLPDAVQAIRAFQMRGVNLSMPHKEAVVPLLDELAPEVRLTGAVNTIVNDGGRLTGCSTDGAGWLRALADLGFDVRGERVTILGAGGAAKEMIARAAMQGARSVAVFNRRASSRWAHAEALVEQVRAQTGCDVTLHAMEDHDALRREVGRSALLANATDVGMGAQAGRSCIPDESYFHSELIVTDAIYAPPETELLRQAREAGCRTQNGVGMMLYQGAESFRLWTGREMPVDLVRPLLGL